VRFTGRDRSSGDQVRGSLLRPSRSTASGDREERRAARPPGRCQVAAAQGRAGGAAEPVSAASVPVPAEVAPGAGSAPDPPGRRRRSRPLTDHGSVVSEVKALVPTPTSAELGAAGVGSVVVVVLVELSWFSEP
jgi:hypothetical protein